MFLSILYSLLLNKHTLHNCYFEIDYMKCMLPIYYTIGVELEIDKKLRENLQEKKNLK